METRNNTAQSFQQLLQKLWSAEKILTEKMPGMIKKATGLGLKKNLAMHFAETDQHKEAIRAICKGLDFSHEGEENEELKTILAQGEEQMNNAAPGDELDTVIINGAIKIEEYEMAAYTEAYQLAKSLGKTGIAARLALTLEEERQADTKLNFLKQELPYKAVQLATMYTGENRPK